MSELTHQQRAEAGQRIKNFLSDPAVKAVFLDLEEQNRNEFLNSTPATRDDAWAKARVLADFSTRMTHLMDDGERARQEILAADARLSRPDARK